jgi:hypothetical protein
MHCGGTNAIVPRTQIPRSFLAARERDDSIEKPHHKGEKYGAVNYTERRAKGPIVRVKLISHANDALAL